MRPLNGLLAVVHKEFPKDRHHGEKKALGSLWTRECQTAFEDLRYALTRAPVLGYADYTKEFILEVDASNHGLGAVLSQMQDGRQRVIAYASRTLRVSESTAANYSSFKLELMAKRWAMVEKFRGYLLGHKCIVYTDNGPLSHWKSAKLGAVEQRWAAEIDVFDHETRYRSGKTNIAADFLSRYPLSAPSDPEEAERTPVFPSPCPLPETMDNNQLREDQQADPDIAVIRPHVAGKTLPSSTERKK